MKKHIFLFVVLIFFFNSVIGQTIFEWETATDNGDNVTETIDGITVTFSGGSDTAIFDNVSGFGGGTSNGVWSAAQVASTTFTFSEAVDVNSIIAIEGNSTTTDYTFTATGGSNAAVTVTLPSGVLPTPVDLNWVNVTSFTVTTSDGAGSYFFFDDLSVFLGEPLSTDDNVIQKARVYPNPVENILHVKNISGLKAIKILNNVGQQILESKGTSLDVSRLSRGIYLLQIHSSQGMETKRIIKN